MTRSSNNAIHRLGCALLVVSVEWLICEHANSELKPPALDTLHDIVIHVKLAVGHVYRFAIFLNLE